MNKLLKIGLLLQIPNVIIFSIITFFLLINYINWVWIISNGIWIFVGTVYLLINVFSIIFLVCSAFESKPTRGYREE